MRFLKIGLGVIAVMAVVVALLAPIGPLPGFIIGGTPATPPATWPDTSKVHEIKLKVPGTLPRVVIIWVIEYAGELYVAGSSDSGWVTRIGNASPVQMRLGDNTYNLTAETVTANQQAILTAYVDKYRPDYPDIVGGFPSVEEAADAFGLFHLKR